MTHRVLERLKSFVSDIISKLINYTVTIFGVECLLVYESYSMEPPVKGCGIRVSNSGGMTVGGLHLSLQIRERKEGGDS